MDKVEYFLNHKWANVKRRRDETEKNISGYQEELSEIHSEIIKIAKEAEKYKIVLMEPKAFEEFQEAEYEKSA